MALATTRENILEMLDKKLKIPGKVFHNYYKYTSDIRGEMTGKYSGDNSKDV